jgi:hypothetical protein
MPRRYLVFSLLVLVLAAGASCHLASVLLHEERLRLPSADRDVEQRSETNLSGRSIAPGGAGGRQS